MQSQTLKNIVNGAPSYSTHVREDLNCNYTLVSDVIYQLKSACAALGVPTNDAVLEVQGDDVYLEVAATRVATPAEIQEYEKSAAMSAERQLEMDRRTIAAIRERSPEVFFEEVIQEPPV